MYVALRNICKKNKGVRVNAIIPFILIKVEKIFTSVDKNIIRVGLVNS